MLFEVVEAGRTRVSLLVLIRLPNTDQLVLAGRDTALRGVRHLGGTGGLYWGFFWAHVPTTVLPLESLARFLGWLLDHQGEVVFDLPFDFLPIFFYCATHQSFVEEILLNLGISTFFWTLLIF